MAELSYLNFDLSIERSGEVYKARVLDSPAGQATNEFERPFSDLELEVFQLRVGRPRQGVRRLDSPEMQLARSYGERLFRAAFGEEVRACFAVSLAAAQRQGKGLRLRLRLNAPEMSSLPWEYLYNPGNDQFLVWSVYTPLVRYFELPQPPPALAVVPPLRVLAMISSPEGYPALDVEGEWAQLKRAVQEQEGRGLIALERLETASLAALRRRLRQGEVHVLHFIGHGKFAENEQDGLLLFEDEERRGRALSGSHLGTLLADHRPLRLVVLNACEGARSGQVDPYAGAAQSLVRQGIPAVIAMQFEITDEAAITFGCEFYAALADNYPLDAALAEARKAIFAEGNDIEWGTPVYFTRTPDGRIFEVGLPAAPRPEAAAARQVDARQAEALRLAEAAMAAEKWEAAIGHWQALLALDPGHAAAREKLAEAEKQRGMQASYEQAVRAYRERKYEQARARFAEVQALEANYRDVGEWLARLAAQSAAPQRSLWMRFASLPWRRLMVVVIAAAALVLASILLYRLSYSPIFHNPVPEQDWIEIPAGEFWMGCDENNPNEDCDSSDELPRHKVYLEAYEIMRYEVTNRQYAQCVKNGKCSARGVEGGENYPVVNVSWEDAVTFCEWAGGRLPTEAEWEKAARGGLEGKLYPWGDEAPTCEKGAENGAQYGSCDGGTIPVGSFAPNGYGLYDMAGNVWEWVQDWYLESFYGSSPRDNPTGPASGEYRVVRGGGWFYYGYYLLSAYRLWFAPSDRLNVLGFRCARSQ